MARELFLSETSFVADTMVIVQYDRLPGVIFINLLDWFVHKSWFYFNCYCKDETLFFSFSVDDDFKIKSNRL